jgi:small subunit ribosomal protein S6
LNTVIENEKRTPSGKMTEKGGPKLYEAMFLVDSAEATTDWDGVTANIKNILEKAGAEIISIKKWDDRKLAYPIKGKSKGAYILCYFKVEGSKLQEIDRDIHLSERIMRALVLCAENRQIEDVEKGPASQTTGESKTRKRAVEERETRDEEQTERPEEDSPAQRRGLAEGVEGTE